VVDKDLSSGRIRTPTPHYKAVNEVPIDGTPAVIKGCFNCGGSHMIRECTFTRDQVCIRLNRYLHDRYNAKGGSSNGGGRNKRRGPQFGNQRYYQSAALTKSASDPTPINSNTNTNTKANANANGNTNGSFDDYLKLVQRGQKAQDKEEKEEQKKVICIDVDPDEDGQCSESNDEMGLAKELASEMEGLKILRTPKEIEDALAAHKLELERDQKKREDLEAKANKRNRRNDRRRNRSRSKETKKAKAKEARVREAIAGWRGHRSGEALHSQSHPGDVDHRRERKEHRDYGDRDRERDRDRRSRRDERGRGRGRRSRSRSGGRGRGGYGERERDRDRDRRSGGRHRREDSDEEIDYGFKKKKDRIIQYINDRYKKDKSEDRDRHRDRDRDRDHDRDRRRTHRR